MRGRFGAGLFSARSGLLEAVYENEGRQLMPSLWEMMADIERKRARRDAWNRRIGCAVTVVVAFALGLAFIYAAAQVWRFAAR